jgi:hypothetical protein
VILRLGNEKTVPSSSQSPVIKGIFATEPCKTSCCGLAVRNTPSTRGNQASAKLCNIDQCRATLRKLTHLVRHEIWGLVNSAHECSVRNLSQALQRVRGTGASGLGHEKVVISLSVSDVTDRDGRSTLHECTTEKSLGIPPIGDHVKPNGPCASTFAPAETKGLAWSLWD